MTQWLNHRGPKFGQSYDVIYKIVGLPKIVCRELLRFAQFYAMFNTTTMWPYISLLY